LDRIAALLVAGLYPNICFHREKRKARDIHIYKLNFRLRCEMQGQLIFNVFLHFRFWQLNPKLRWFTRHL
jgi:hypothetical protein